jgi:hypothetical protein
MRNNPIIKLKNFQIQQHTGKMKKDQTLTLKNTEKKSSLHNGESHMHVQ